MSPDILRESAWGQWYLRKKEAGHSFYRYATFYTLEELQELMTSAGFILAAVTSAITQAPGERVEPEPAYEGVKPGASFVCLLGKAA